MVETGRSFGGEITGKLLRVALKAAFGAQPLHLFFDAVNFFRS